VDTIRPPRMQARPIDYSLDRPHLTLNEFRLTFTCAVHKCPDTGVEERPPVFSSHPSQSFSKSTPQGIQETLFPTLPKARIPSFPATLMTTVSISKPLFTTTKFVTTGGLPSVKPRVNVPVQSPFTV
jgi:hypothetical protein